MIPAAFDYVRAKSLGDALKHLNPRKGVKLVAGGHSLLPLLRLRLAQATRLVDIGHLKELRGIAVTKAGARIGAATTYRELLASKALRERWPLVAEATATVGDLQVRNRGTIGGGLAHADPAADLPAVMLALDASFTLRSRRGRRSVKARAFFKDAFTTAMKADELLLDVVLPPPPAGAGMAYVSFEQAASGYAIAGAAAVVARSGGRVSTCALALTGVGDVAYLAESGRTLVGTAGDAAAVATAAAGAVEGVTVAGDIHAPAEYRRHLAVVAARRALVAALARAK